jgi:hypothetical protein
MRRRVNRMSNLGTNFQILLGKLQKVKQDKLNHYMACCPAHNDKNQSLSITVKNNRILMYCFAGCDTASILRSIDANYKDLFQDDKPDLIAVDRYTYTDEEDNLLFYTIRYLPKTFKQCHIGANGETIWNLEGVRRVLYRLSDAIRAINYGKTLFITEGEKDCDNLWLKAMQPATCNPMGAGKWNDSYTQTLQGAREIVIIPDNDPAGYNHARIVAEALYGKVGRLRILLIPAPFKDFSDWIEAIPKWNNNGRLDYDYEAIPEDFKNLAESAVEYTPEYRFPTPRVKLQTSGGIPL